MNIKAMTTVKVKILNNSISLPKYETINSAGMDIRAFIQDIVIKIKPRETKLIPTGLHFEIPKGFEVQIRPRSGLALKNGITVLNSPGTIDADYRGEIKIILINHSNNNFIVTNGMRIAQMVVTQFTRIELIEVNELSETDRGEGGFGSTGTN
jgi:dUTP pyrophosphatase|tara:strand:- start:58 stop:516 length:459 start_codon:yes stop_codon:yes gene_type:complete